MKAKKMFEEGFNCSQSVFVPFAVKQNIDRNIATKLMSPFGGGISGTDSLCGAVSGGISAIGLAFGHIGPDDIESKQKCAEVTQEFISEFKKEFKSIDCTKLIGYNLASTDEKERAVESGIFKSECPKYVEFASNTINKLIDEHK